MSLAATATMVLMLLLLAGFWIIQTGLLAGLEFVEQKVEVVAYLQHNAHRRADRRRSATKIEAMPEVASVEIHHPRRGARAVPGSAGGAGPRGPDPVPRQRTRCYASIEVKLERPDGTARRRRRCAPASDPIVRNVINIEDLVDRVLDRHELPADRRDACVADRRRRHRAVHHRQHDPARGRRPGRGDRDHAARRRVGRVHPLAVRVRGRASSGCSGRVVTLGVLRRSRPTR